ncbi:MAG: NADH dehydrogenase (quinone) subunit G [Acidobacteria bacterium]|nr:MAG: NADH dehydrogenase (quinone) subunit G [Acidobacteriota bacterium]
MADTKASPEAEESQASPERLKVTIDGVTTEVEPGTLLIEAALKAGKYIPHFCWHPRMKPVAKCRMCLVEVEDQRGLPPACTTPCSNEMVVHTDTPIVQQVQESVLELLLANHPLDCPVCDRGGECPLQDQTMAYGPGESRFVEEKRHYEKPIALSELVLLDRERCILCDRCTRFADEVAGDPLIAFVERGNRTHVLTFPDEPFRSYFSGNTIEACPVGALTAVPYRFKARPWDLEEVESTCAQCAVGCRVKLQSSSSRVLRVLGVDSEEVNQGWLCDKGRFGFEYLHHDDRLTAPMIRIDGELVEASWGEALDAAADGIKRAAKEGPDALGFLGGSRSTTESAYAFSKLARIAGTNNVDAQLGDGLEAAFLVGANPRASIANLDSAAAIVVAGPDLKEELPVLYLRVKQAALKNGVPLIECSPMQTGLSRYAAVSLIHRAGETAQLLSALAGAAQREPTDRPPAGASATDFQRAVEIISEACDKNAVVIAGRTGLATSDGELGASATQLAEAIGGLVLPVAHRANTMGALFAGCAPDLLPGGSRLADGDGGSRAAIEKAWGRAVPSHEGRDASGIVTEAARGNVGALVLMGADLIDDFPDRSLGLEAIGRTGFIVAIDIFMTPTAAAADVVFPAATFGEQSGCVVNIEGRVTRQVAKVAPPGSSQPEWYLLDQLTSRISGKPARWTSHQDVFEEMAAAAPAFAEVTRASIEGAKGTVVRASDTYAPQEIEHPPIATDQYNHRVIAGRKLYGDGQVSGRCTAFRRIDTKAVARLNSRDMSRLGVEDGVAVRLRGARADLEIAVMTDDSVPEGSVSVPFNRIATSSGADEKETGESALHPIRVADLIDSTAAVNEVRIETLESPA